MTEYTFFTSKKERWGEKMRAIWGDLSICSCLDSLELPSHTLGGIAFHQLPENLGGHSGAQ